MKKAMIIVAILGVGLISKAQTVSFGPTGGFGHSWITNSSGDGQFNPAWNVGVSLVYSSRSNFGLGADVKYSAEGNKVTENGVTSTINTNYVRVPLKLIYFFGSPNSAVRPKISAGPTLGFLTGANSAVSDQGVKVKTDITDNIKSFDFGVNAAAGLNFRVAPRTWLNTDIALYQGLTDITKSNNSTQHNGNIGVDVGLLFGLGK
jgi:outer membrane protein W